ncbi:hypothetical protein ACC720_16555 [Rhizobium ruizarguesonis]
MTLPADRPSPKADVRKIWNWIHVTNELWICSGQRVDDDFDPSFLPAADALPEREQKPKPAKPEPHKITRREQRAIRSGFYLRSQKWPDPWAEVRRCLEAETVTRDFRRLVARMIEGNILHANGSVPASLDRGDTMRRRELYVNHLKDYYADLGKLDHKPLAERLVAFDLCMDHYDYVETSEIANWSAFEASWKEVVKQVKSICDRKRGGDKAAKGIGAEVLAAVGTARLLPED